MGLVFSWGSEGYADRYGAGLDGILCRQDNKDIYKDGLTRTYVCDRMKSRTNVRQLKRRNISNRSEAG